MGVKKVRGSAQNPVAFAALLLMLTPRVCDCFVFRGWWVCAVCHGLVWLTWHSGSLQPVVEAGHGRSLAGGTRHLRGWLVSHFHGGGGAVVGSNRQRFRARLGTENFHPKIFVSSLDTYMKY